MDPGQAVTHRSLQVSRAAKFPCPPQFLFIAGESFGVDAVNVMRPERV